MKIGKLNMHCGECELIEHCGEPYSDIAICCEKRFEDVHEEVLYKLLENSNKRDKKSRLDDAYNILKG